MPGDGSIQEVADRCRRLVGVVPAVVSMPSMAELSWSEAELPWEPGELWMVGSGTVAGVPVPMARLELFEEADSEPEPMTTGIEALDRHLERTGAVQWSGLQVIDRETMAEPVEGFAANWILILEDRTGYFARLLVQCLRQRTQPFGDQRDVAARIRRELALLA